MTDDFAGLKIVYFPTCTCGLEPMLCACKDPHVDCPIVAQPCHPDCKHDQGSSQRPNHGDQIGVVKSAPQPAGGAEAKQQSKRKPYQIVYGDPAEHKERACGRLRRGPSAIDPLQPPLYRDSI